MGTLIKVIVLLFCVNLFVYVGSNYRYMITGDIDDKPIKVNGDLIDILMKIAPQPINATSSSIIFNESLNMPSKESTELVGSGGGISWLDVLSILWGFFVTLFNIAAASILIFFSGGTPPIIGLMVGVPLVLIELLSIFAFIRGVSD